MSEQGQRKKISIYLMMQDGEDRNYPMEVVTFTHAKVQDLVGLICWQYTREGRKPKLKSNANSYCLRIAEETGEVDEDFPSLESKEPVAKFDFPVLALVEKEEDGDQVVTMYATNVLNSFLKVVMLKMLNLFIVTLKMSFPKFKLKILALHSGKFWNKLCVGGKGSFFLKVSFCLILNSDHRSCTKPNFVDEIFL